MKTMDRRQIFASIYRRNGWGGVRTRSGPGSELEATATLRRELPRLVGEFGISSLLDAGCGEALWQPELPGYVGIDIVPSVIALARRRHPTWEFRVADLVTDPLPSVDAVMCREVLMHLSLADGLAVLENLRTTGARWLIATSYPDQTNPLDTLTGGYYRCNLQADPFSFAPPIRTIDDAAWVGPWATKGPWWEANPTAGIVRGVPALLGIWEMSP